LEIINQELAQEKPHPYLGHATLHPGLISGGTGQSVIAAMSKLNWERRILPGESQDKLDTELKRVISAIENANGDHTVKARQTFNRPPNEIPKDDLVVKLKKAAGNTNYNGMSYWADSALASQAGIPSILFGPAGHGAHAVDEWVSLASLVNCYESMKRFILDFD
jgi:acetylornithine deacetylase